MGNEFANRPEHSAEYFGDTRDHWWNADFLELLARRWRLAEAQSVLDVGCGVGHWGRLLLAFLPPGAVITGVDREAQWVAEAQARAVRLQAQERFRYQQAEIERLPFAAGSFDLVTCQTVLIHSPAPAEALAAMIRVAKPGGLIAVAEPNNLADSLLADTQTLALPIEELLALVRFQALCERGKAALGEGNNSAGEELPGLFAAAGLEDVRVYLNDKASPMLPPYSAPEQRASVEELAEFVRREIWIWSHSETLRYFRAGGGSEREFESLWALGMARRRAAASSIGENTYRAAGGTVTYCISGRKPVAGPPT